MSQMKKIPLGLKYLGVDLGDESVQQKNWDGIIEKMEGRLKKWRWIHSQLSFRGRVLILNNLIASTMWHCVEPPTGLLSHLQTILVDFFWDRLHWVPQSMLFLPVEEGGPGLVSLSSRYATFRLQFIQKFLIGSVDVIWREVAKKHSSQSGWTRTRYCFVPHGYQKATFEWTIFILPWSV